MYPNTYRNPKSSMKLTGPVKNTGSSAWSRALGRNPVSHHSAATAAAGNNVRTMRHAMPNLGRATALMSSGNATGSGNGSASGRKAAITSAPASKCKFTDRKLLAPKQTRSMALEPSRKSSTPITKPVSTMKSLSTSAPASGIASNNNNNNSSSNNTNTTTTGVSERKRIVPHSVAQAVATTRTRIWNRNREAAAKLEKAAEKAEDPHCQEMGIQTNELEILNSDLIIGDVKILRPSQVLAYTIDRERDEARKRELLKARRKFQEHDKREEEHLTDLQEFLEKAAITKRTRKQAQSTRPSLDMDRKLISSMDELLAQAVPKAESITDIKGRIKKKEQELLSLFETIDNFKIESVQ